MTSKKTLKICSIIFGFSLLIAWIIIALKPETRRARPQISSPMVNVVAATIDDATMNIRALGTVKSAQETIIRPRVVGQVELLGKNSDTGAVVKKGELLIQLDPAIYKNTLNSKKSALAKAEADYALEMGQQKVARAEAEQLKNISASIGAIGTTGTEENNIQISPLTLRVPHLAQAKAAVDAAKAEVKLAQLNVDYTSITAPYNALITARNISIGSQASTADQLLVLVGTDEYRIEAAIALDRLEALDLKNSAGTKVRIISGAGLVREGVVLRTIAALDPSTRMGRLLISVPDPLGLENEEPALILGDQAQVELIAGTLNNVIVLPRASLQSGDAIWVAVPIKKSENLAIDSAQASAQETAEEAAAGAAKNPKISGTDSAKNTNKTNYILDIRPVTVVWKDTQTVYISNGIKEGEFIVTSPIPSPLQGMSLRLTPQNMPNEKPKNTSPKSDGDDA